MTAMENNILRLATSNIDRNDQIKVNHAREGEAASLLPHTHNNIDKHDKWGPESNDFGER